MILAAKISGSSVSLQALYAPATVATRVRSSPRKRKTTDMAYSGRLK